MQFNLSSSCITPQSPKDNSPINTDMNHGFHPFSGRKYFFLNHWKTNKRIKKTFWQLSSKQSLVFYSSIEQPQNDWFWNTKSRRENNRKTRNEKVSTCSSIATLSREKPASKKNKIVVESTEEEREREKKSKESVWSCSFHAIAHQNRVKRPRWRRPLKRNRRRRRRKRKSSRWSTRMTKNSWTVPCSSATFPVWSSLFSLTWIATILKNPNLLKKLFSKYGEIDNFRFRYFPCWRLHFLALSPWTVLPSSTTLKRRSARYFQIQNHHSRLVFSPATWVMKSNVWTPTLSTRPPRASSRPRKWTTTYIVKRSCWFLSC